jgi:hypothetical protein
MSEPSSSAPGTAGTAKKPVSPARNIIGVIVLIAVVVVGWLEYSAKAGYNAAVTAVNQRLEDEEHGLPAQSEIENKIGKSPDDAGSDVQEGGATYVKKTYTWKGLIGSYSMAAYYTKGREPALHHIEAGEKYQPQTPAATGQPGTGASPRPSSEAPSPDPSKRFEAPKGKADTKAAPADRPKAEEKPKAGADEKPKAPEPKAEEKPKAGADEKPKAPAKAD